MLLSSTSSSSTKKPPAAWLQRQALETVILQCKECGSTDIVEDHAQGDAVCSNCGVVVGERLIDEDAEWRNFEGDTHDKSRVGGPLNPHLAEDLSTAIGKAKDGRSRGLARINAKTNTATADKNLMDAFEEIGRFVSLLDLSQRVKDRAFEFYADEKVRNKFRGRKNDAVIPACVLAASRAEGCGRSIKEIANFAKSTKKEIGHAYKIIVGEIKPPDMPTLSSSDLPVRFCAHLNLPKEITLTIESVVKKVEQLDIAAGRVPNTKVATVIFMITQLTHNYQRAIEDIAAVSGVADSTIRSCYRDDMFPRQNELIPQSFQTWLKKQQSSSSSVPTTPTPPTPPPSS